MPLAVQSNTNWYKIYLIFLSIPIIFINNNVHFKLFEIELSVNKLWWRAYCEAFVCIRSHFMLLQSVPHLAHHLKKKKKSLTTPLFTQPENTCAVCVSISDEQVTICHWRFSVIQVMLYWVSTYQQMAVCIYISLKKVPPSKSLGTTALKDTTKHHWWK